MQGMSFNMYSENTNNIFFVSIFTKRPNLKNLNTNAICPRLHWILILCFNGRHTHAKRYCCSLLFTRFSVCSHYIWCLWGQMTDIYVWVQTSHCHREKIHSTKSWRLKFEQLLQNLQNKLKWLIVYFSKKNFSGKATFTLNFNQQS